MSTQGHRAGIKEHAGVMTLLNAMRLRRLVGAGLLATGCAAAERPAGVTPFRGSSGSVTWEVTDVGQLTSTDGQRTRWSYVIVLKETAGTAVSFERVERGSYSPGMEVVGGTPESILYRRTLGANGETRYPTWDTWGWMPSGATRQAFGGAATIQPLVVERRFFGQTGPGQPVTVVVRVRLDRSVGKVAKPLPVTTPVPPARRLEAADLPRLAGSWRGAYRADDGPFDIPLAFTIAPDGSLEVAENDPVTNLFRGTLSVQDGQLAYQRGPDRGTLGLHEGDRKSFLVGHVSGMREGQPGRPPTQFGFTVRLERQ